MSRLQCGTCWRQARALTAGWCAEWKHPHVAGEDGLQRHGAGVAGHDSAPPPFEPVADRVIVEGAKAASVAGMPIGDDTLSRKSSKKGRFNVTAASMPLNRSSVNRVSLFSPLHASVPAHRHSVTAFSRQASGSCDCMCWIQARVAARICAIQPPGRSSAFLDSSADGLGVRVAVMCMCVTVFLDLILGT